MEVAAADALDVEVYVETCNGFDLLRVPSNLTLEQRAVLRSMPLIAPSGRPLRRVVSATRFRMRVPKDQHDADLPRMLERIRAMRTRRRRAGAQRAERTRLFVERLLAMSAVDAAELLVVQRRSRQAPGSTTYRVATPNGYRPDVLRKDVRMRGLLDIAARIASERNAAREDGVSATSQEDSQKKSRTTSRTLMSKVSAAAKRLLTGRRRTRAMGATK